MNLALTQTRSAIGIHAKPVSVEVHLSNGLPGFTIVGLAETAVKESKDRVRSALINSQFEFPCRKIIVNLAPADLPKSGSGFDLPIAIGILAASGQIPMPKLANHEFIGELALDGNLRAINSIIPVVISAHREQRYLIIPENNADEAALVASEYIFTASNLRAVCSYICQDTPLNSPPQRSQASTNIDNIDWSDIKGQEHAKQAMFIAAAGGHSILLSGAPGSGKTMLARRFLTLLPELSEAKALECAAIRSIHGKAIEYDKWLTPPFRAPHHTASTAALVGGGNPPKPGEISLAHNGVLFLDELPEFSRHTLETLREPLESGQVCISRAAIQTEFPAQFQLVAAMNPCPCGQWGNLLSDCICAPERIQRYLSKLSGPLLDRIDIQINIQPLPQEELLEEPNTDKTLSVRLRAEITKIQQIQYQRQGCLNAQLTAKRAEINCTLSEAERQFLAQVLTKLNLSARAYHRLLKVARTIADMHQEQRVEVHALKQALAFKQTLFLPK